MELENLKNSWESLELEAMESNYLQSDAILNSIAKKYRQGLNGVIVFEVILMLGSFYFAVLLLFAFDKLDTIYLAVLGMVTIVLLIGLPVLRFLLLKSLYRLRHPDQAITQVIRKFTQQKIRFQKLKQVQAIFGFLLIIALSILCIKIYNEYDVMQSNSFWLIVGLLSIGFSWAFNKWVLQGYNQSIKQAEALLSELV